MKIAAVFAASALALLPLAAQAQNQPCEGVVVNVRPISQYNHAAGNGFLAVKAGPSGGSARQGELYAGDRVGVYGRQGKWYAVSCEAGRCENPLWGPAYPQGWSHVNYIRIVGACSWR